MLSKLAKGDHWFYKLENGGAGIVKAESASAAEEKVKEAYKKHGLNDFSENIEIYEIYQEPFKDEPDVIEIYEY